MVGSEVRFPVGFPRWSQVLQVDGPPYHPAVRTQRIDLWLRRDFAGASAEAAVELVDRIGAELAAWRIVSETDRVEAAALKYAKADLQELGERS